ncbi:hypothetical protein EVAR_17538_1 [Eumeta japonica]|uniref:Uncharacterized protein n=1 Tax=Eumeta variegata TaxID=151549 RepID=A0A4C1WSC0_EUMVA|nr:hypothetical protein EVAR_17538_1 [Eumeta japonica]
MQSKITANPHWARPDGRAAEPLAVVVQGTTTALLTYLPTNQGHRADVLDIILSHKVKWLTHIEVVYGMDTQHLPITVGNSKRCGGGHQYTSELDKGGQTNCYGFTTNPGTTPRRSAAPPYGKNAAEEKAPLPSCSLEKALPFKTIDIKNEGLILFTCR